MYIQIQAFKQILIKTELPVTRNFLYDLVRPTVKTILQGLELLFSKDLSKFKDSIMQRKKYLRAIVILHNIILKEICHSARYSGIFKLTRAQETQPVTLNQRIYQ